MPTLYLYTNHPLAFSAIHKMMAALEFTVQPFSAAHDHSPDHGSWILILDTCSVPEWTRVLAYCRSLAGLPIVLTAEPCETVDDELRLVYLGAHAIIPITRFDTELPSAIACILEDRLWISRRALDEHLKRTKRLGNMSSTAHRFTVREEQVIALLTQGYSNKRISETLAISERTVKFHVSNILRKNNIDSRKDLVLNLPMAQRNLLGDLRRAV